MATFVAVLYGCLALFLGGAVSIALIGGLGPCGSELTLGSALFCMLIAIVVSLFGPVIVPKNGNLGAACFSLPIAFIVIASGLARDWNGFLSSVLCIAAAFVSVCLGAKAPTSSKY
jgi:hypothetical protein